MKLDTKSLGAALTMIGDTPIVNYMPLIQAYHVARCADALERIADHIENGQIALLEGPDINNRLSEIKMVLQNK